MKRIDANTVDLTDDEMSASEYFDTLLDEGKGILVAGERVRNQFPGLDPEFYNWLET